MLEGRVAVVTGGARGLGRAIAKRFTAEGAAVAVWDLGEADGVSLADQVDVSDPAAVAEAATRVRERWGPVAILVNNAGVAEACPPWEVTDSDRQRIMRTNRDGAFWCARACRPDMRAAVTARSEHRVDRDRDRPLCKHVNAPAAAPIPDGQPSPRTVSPPSITMVWPVT